MDRFRLTCYISSERLYFSLSNDKNHIMLIYEAYKLCLNFFHFYFYFGPSLHFMTKKGKLLYYFFILFFLESIK